MNCLNKKVALITGGTRGIGAATAELMCEAGAKVVVIARNEEVGQAFEAEMRTKGHELTFITHDASSIEDSRKLIDKVAELYGGLHVMVNNAAIGGRKLFEEVTLKDYEQMFDINVKGVFFGIQAALPLMRETVKGEKSGSIVNVSTASVTNSTALETCYNATKGAVQCLTHTLAREFGEQRYNIRVNTVNPGFVWTDMAQRSMERTVEKGSFESVDAAKQYFIDRYYPIGRMANPEDVAKVINFLASDDAGYVTGALYAVDGGETA